MATPYEIYMEAQKRRQLLGSDYIGADMPPETPPVTPTGLASIPQSTGYERILPENNAPPFVPPAKPTPLLPPFTPPTSPTPLLPMPETSTLDKMNQTQGKGTIPTEGFISKVGRGAVAGLSELFKGIRMGPEGYQQHQQYLERLPYEKKAYEERMTLETAQRKGESDYDYSNRLKLAQETAKLKPIITLDQEIDNTMKYMGMLTADNKITGKKEIFDPTRYNALANQLDELLKKREIAQPVAPQSSGAIGGANAPVNQQANAEMITAIQSMKQRKTAEEIRKLLTEAGENPAQYEQYLR